MGNGENHYLLDISKNELCVVQNPCRDYSVLRLYVFYGDVYYQPSAIAQVQLTNLI
jgi:hypothetical protein